MYPRPFLGVADIFVYLVVDRVFVWVGEGAGMEGIMLTDESFGGVREVWNHVGDVAAGEFFFLGRKDGSEHLFTGGTGGG